MATSASQRTDNSLAFFINPFRRFENVTCRLLIFSIFLISTLPLPMSDFGVFYDVVAANGNEI